jgi:8-oxo-dGTP pyrophosphatase MutT (NUDIX family)
VYRRVVAYVLRDDAVLVFDHRDIPQAGTQFPAGTVEDGEEPAAAAVREVLEECGVRARVTRELGATDEIAPRGDSRRNYFFALTTDDPRDEWEHVVVGGGGDAGLVFACRFAPRTSLPVLARDDDFLDEL